MVNGNAFGDRTPRAGLLIRRDPGRPPCAVALRPDTVPVIGYQDNGVRQRDSLLGVGFLAVGLSYQDRCCPSFEFPRPRVDLP